MQLKGGDEFPQLTALNLEDEKVTIPDLFGESWGVVLFYRGHW